MLMRNSGRSKNRGYIQTKFPIYYSIIDDTHSIYKWRHFIIDNQHVENILIKDATKNTTIKN